MCLFRKCVFIITIAVFTVFSPGISMAGIDQSLKDIFNSFAGIQTSGTDAGAYTGQTRGYLTGGSASIRIPNKSINLLSFKGPSVSAGCGGIDLYTGTFSYINADQIQTLLENIGSSAIGYVVQIGIETLCQQCATVISKMESAVRAINKLANDSCAAAKALTSGVTDKIRGTLGSQSANNGDVTDFAAINANLRKVTSWAEKAAGTDQTVYGNVVWNGFMKAGINTDDAHLIMSATGSVIFFKPDEDKSTDATGAASSNLSKYIPPLIAAKDLLAGGYVDIYECESYMQNGCLNPTKTSTEITGYYDQVTNVMTNIANDLKNRTALTAEEQNFINIVPIPALKLLEYAPDDDVRTWEIAELSQPIAEMLVHQWLSYALNQLQTVIYNTPSTMPLEPDKVASWVTDIKDRIASTETYMKNDQMAIAKYTEIVSKFEDSLRANTGNLFGNLYFR